MEKFRRSEVKRSDAPADIVLWVLVLLFFSIFIVLVVTGCNGFFIGPTLTSVAVGPSSPSVTVGKTQQMSATATYDNGSTDTVTTSASWSTSDATIATVSSTGFVTAVASGSATISATLNGVSGSTTVTVTVADLKSISVTPTSYTIDSGQTEQYDAIGLLADGTTTDLTSSVTWTSSNTAAATIDSSGLATALTVSSNASTNITAQSGSITSNTAVLTVDTTE